MQLPNKAWRAEASALGGTAIAVTATMTAQLTISAVETFAAARLGMAVLAGVTLALSFHLLAFLFTLERDLRPEPRPDASGPVPSIPRV